MTNPGRYAKGIAKRDEILTRAVEVVGRAGPRTAYLTDIADAVGLTPAGLLHYFDSKEELFTEVLRKRDQVDVAQHWPKASEVEDLAHLRRGYVDIIRHNAEVPGLVQLFTRMCADAPDPSHPAHRLFLERGRKLRAYFATGIAALQARGELDASIDPEMMARILQAVSDGLQLQWMIEPDVDMAAGVDALFALLTPRPDATDESAKP
ncbi:MAG: TetR family transcriptional regulator [Micropruina sp.]|uniref:TetR/AcrR family transcriptional regulator n=1 Tax=Micropruina sp. TaxID=2737536 RepID=UPI0039E71EC5